MPDPSVSSDLPSSITVIGTGDPSPIPTLTDTQYISNALETMLNPPGSVSSATSFQSVLDRIEAHGAQQIYVIDTDAIVNVDVRETIEKNFGIGLWQAMAGISGSGPSSYTLDWLQTNISPEINFDGNQAIFIFYDDEFAGFYNTSNSALW